MYIRLCVCLRTYVRMSVCSLMNEVVHTSPTIGSNVEEITWRNFKFIMWDIGGQESLRQAWSTYYSSAKVLIFVVDSTDRERLTVNKEELYSMLGHEVGEEEGWGGVGWDRGRGRGRCGRGRGGVG